MSASSLNKLYQTYNLVIIVNKPNCLKDPKSLSRLDLVLTGKQERLLKAKITETGLSHDKMVISVFETTIRNKNLI